MAVAFVKKLGISSGTATTASFTPTNAGDCIVAVAQDGNNTTGTFSYSGSVAGTWAAVGQTASVAGLGVLGLGTNLSTLASAQTATVATTAASPNLQLDTFEYSGVASVGSFSARVDAVASTNVLSGTAVTVPTGSVLVAACYQTGGAATDTVTGVGGGGSLRDAYSGPGSNAVGVGDWAGSGASITPTFNVPNSTDTWLVVQVILTASAGSSPPLLGSMVW